MAVAMTRLADRRLAKELVEACEAALARIERLNIGAEQLGEDEIVTQLREVIAKAHIQWPFIRR